VTESKKQTSTFDAFIGEKVKFRRMLLGMSQEKLGDLLGLTFQQIQKYEKGVNRISAGRLFEVSVHLSAPIESFYEGLPLGGDTSQGFAESSENSEISKLLVSSEGYQMGAAFAGIKNANVRKRLIDLMKCLGDKPDEPKQNS
jgi:transcriptional regulator with XRE-family HTH domain